MTIDLNVDLGEGFGAWRGAGDDEQLLQYVTSANVACGFHAGDPSIMRVTVAACVAAGVAVGAHPSYPDLRGFGRVPMMLPVERVVDDVVYQVGALQAVARLQGTRVGHVKPHGALYEAVAVDPALALRLANALAALGADLVLVLPARSAAASALAAAGHGVRLEGFADRAYLAGGLLAPRRRAGAVLEDEETVTAQALALALGEEFPTQDGTTLRLTVDTVCLHSDTRGATDLARAVRRRLSAAGVTLAAPSGQ
ncbi:MAG: 5-oxoprolinase subunit PxpA [Truepera sp.]|nr:5-oxoprolinase subunit PxpA [Truepera sp.]